MVIESAERRVREGEREVMISSAHLMRNPPFPGRPSRSSYLSRLPVVPLTSPTYLTGWEGTEKRGWDERRGEERRKERTAAFHYRSACSAEHSGMREEILHMRYYSTYILYCILIYIDIICTHP